MAKIVFPDIDLTGVKGVLSDLDNTIYNFEDCNTFALESCYKYNPLKCASSSEFNAQYAKYRQIMVDKLAPNPACRSRMLVFQNMLEALKIKNPYNPALKMENCYWKNFLKVAKVDEKALEFLKQCKKKKIPVCLVTDMLIGVQVLKLRKLKVINYIDYVVASEEVAIEKPAPIIFNTALAKLGLSAEDVIMIGDNLKKDIKGAEALGIKSYFVKVLK